MYPTNTFAAFSYCIVSIWRHRWKTSQKPLVIFSFRLVKSSYGSSALSCSLSSLLSSGGSMELISTRLSAAFVSNIQAGRGKKRDGRPYFSFKEGFTLLPRRRLFVLTPFGFWTRTERICGHKCIRFGLAGLAGGC